ncbi:MAG: hypothetical protein WKF73_06215 [Nocardioidaceae bacterium]
MALTSVIAFFDAGARAARGALIAKAVTADRRVHARAYLRSITNIDITLGAAVAAIALHLDTPAAYKTLIVIDACTYAVSVLVLRWLPRVAPVTRERSMAKAGVVLLAA